MASLRALALVSLAACASTLDRENISVDDEVYDLSGKADSQADVDLEYCKQVAGDYARKHYNDFKGFDILEVTTSAEPIASGRGYLVIRTENSGHDVEFSDDIMVSNSCYAIGSTFELSDLRKAALYARKSAAAVTAHIEETWDFDRILSAEPTITPTEISVFVRALDGGFDEGSFRVKLTRRGRVESIEVVQPFTP